MISPPKDTWSPTPQAVQKGIEEKEERDWATTVEIMKQAVLSFGSVPPANDLELQERCEALWQWAKTENWKAP